MVKIKKSSVLINLQILLLLLLSSCSSVVEHLALSPEVEGIRLSSFSVADRSAQFEVDLFNPNSFPLPISALTGNIQLNQQIVGHISAESEGSLAANSMQTIHMPLQLDIDALISAAQKLLSSRSAEYNFTGTIKTSIIDIPVSKTGKLSLSDLLSKLLTRS